MKVPRAVIGWVAIPLLLMAACSGTATSPTGNDAQQTLRTTDRRDRTFYVHVPKPRPSGAMALVLLFHGGGGDAPGMERIAHFDRLADEHGILAIYPQGFQDSWNDGAGNTPAEKAGVDDVAFVSSLLDWAQAHYLVDPNRVAAAGFSNGALFAELVGCRLAGRLSLIFPVAGPLPTDVAPGCRPGRPLSVVAVHGAADPVVPYGGGQGQGFSGGARVLSAPESIAEWARLDGCGPTATDAAQPSTVSDGTTVSLTSYSGCSAKATVELYTVSGGGHTWPGGEQYAPINIVGRASRQFDAGELLWTLLAGLASG
jgi:polyhydroxybutyrate depolymerase